MKPPPGNGTGVKPGMTGGALKAAGPRANWLAQPERRKARRKSFVLGWEVC